METNKMTGHVHAKLMAEYAVDAVKTDKPWKLWRCRHISKDASMDLVWHPEWHTFNIYERIPQTININGFEVPEPVRSELNYGDEYWMPSFENFSNEELSIRRQWSESSIDIHIKRLSHGLIHLSREAAELHCRALLSFTKGC